MSECRLCPGGPGARWGRPAGAAPPSSYRAASVVQTLEIKSIHKCIVGDQWKSVSVFKLYVRSIPELGKDGKRRRGGKNQKRGGVQPGQRGETLLSVRQRSSGSHYVRGADLHKSLIAFPSTPARIHGAIS